jgi:hypothetical protein
LSKNTTFHSEINKKRDCPFSTVVKLFSFYPLIFSHLSPICHFPCAKISLKSSSGANVLERRKEFENAIYETERASLEISDQCILKSFQNICKALREVEKKLAELKTDCKS